MDRETAPDSDAETQEPDSEPDPYPFSSSDSEDRASGGGGGETLPLDDDIYEETQVVEDWADTQVMDNDGDTDCTEVLGDDDDGDRVLDDAGTTGRADDAECAPLSDASVGEDMHSGSARKSFSAVRTASLRASGRTAVSKSTPSCSAYEQSSILLKSKFNEEHQVDIDGKHRRGDAENHALEVGAVNNASFADARRTDKHSNDKFVNSDSFIFSSSDDGSTRIGNSIVRSLFQEDTITHGLDDTPLQPTGGDRDDKISQASAHCAAGLSYIGSQEPGELSQANAIEVVDRLLCFNELGLSEDACDKNKTQVASALSTGAKGAQILANAAQKSPAGKKAVFEWNDAFEDEGGGDFFVKRKGSFFDNRDKMKKSQSLPPKVRLPRLKRTPVSCEKRKKMDALSPKSDSKLNKSSSGSIRQQFSLTRHGNCELRTPKNAVRKNILEDRQKNVNGESIKHNLEEDNAFHDVGPDTQMAADAMEFLAFAAPDELNIPVHKKPQNGVFSDDPRQLADLGKGHFTSATTRKRSLSVLDSNATVRRSKRNRGLSAKVSIEIQVGFEKESQKPAMTKKSKKGTPRINLSEKPHDVNDKEKCLLGNMLSVRGDTTNKKNGKLANSDKKRKIDQDKSMPSVELPLSKKHQKDISWTPISHRTRRSIAGKTEKLVVLADVHTTVKVSDMEMASSSNHKTAESALNSSEDVRRCDLRQRDALLDQLGSVGVPCQEAEFLTAVAPFHPKRRRTCITRELSSVEDKSLLHSNKVNSFIKNPSMIKDGNDDTKRMIDLPPKDDAGLYNGSYRPPGVRTRSSSDLDRLNAPKCNKDKHFFNDNYNFHNLPAGPDLRKVYKELQAPPCYTNSFSDRTSEDPKSRTLLDRVSDTISNSPGKKAIEGSPICTSITPSNTIYKEKPKSSVSRELIRLVSSEMTRIPVMTDTGRKEISSFHVLFSRHLEEKVVKHLEKITKRLGISVVSSISDATHFIADKFVRTRNLLEAMAVGKPVVTPLWLKKCGQISSFIDEKNYILRDLKKEKEIGFSMPVSLACSIQNPILQGKRIFLTPNVKPDRQTISSLIKAAGGQPIERIGRSTMNDDKVLDDLLVVSCEEDYTACIPLLEKGAKVYNSELVLNGIVIQKLEYERHRLFLDHVKQTRSTIWLKSEGSNEFHQVAKRK